MNGSMTSYGFPVLGADESRAWLVDHAGARRSDELSPPIRPAALFPVGEARPVLRVVALDGSKAALEANAAFEAGLMRKDEAFATRSDIETARTARNVQEQAAAGAAADDSASTSAALSDLGEAVAGAPALFFDRAGAVLGGAVETVTSGVSKVLGSVVGGVTIGLWPILLMLGAALLLFLLLR